MYESEEVDWNKTNKRSKDYFITPLKHAVNLLIYNL